MVAVAVLGGLALMGWLIYRGVRDKPIKAYMVSYGVAIVAAIFTFAFFLNMDIPQLFKITASIILGIALIFVAAYIQRRHQDKPGSET